MKVTEKTTDNIFYAIMRNGNDLNQVKSSVRESKLI